MGIILNVDSIAGGSITEAIYDAKCLSKKICVMVSLNINDINLPIHPSDSLKELIDRYENIQNTLSEREKNEGC